MNKKVQAVLSFTLLLSIGLSLQARAEEHDGLRFIIYGSSGNVGSRVATEALNRGHTVTGVSRNPDRVKLRHDRLTVAKGDVLDPTSVAELIPDHDVVVVSVRGSADGSNNPEQAVHRVAANLLVNALRELGDKAPRLIYVGGAGSLEVKPGVTYAESIPKIMLPKSMEQEIEGHVLTLGYLRTVDDVRWTYISPAKKFGPGKRTGNYRIGGDQMLEDKKGKSRISMEDFAVALVDEAENAAHVGKRFSVAY